MLTVIAANACLPQPQSAFYVPVALILLLLAGSLGWAWATSTRQRTISLLTIGLALWSVLLGGYLLWYALLPDGAGLSCTVGHLPAGIRAAPPLVTVALVQVIVALLTVAADVGMLLIMLATVKRLQQTPTAK